MPRPQSPQEWVHWLEMGAGARWTRRLALALGILLLTALIGYKQFRGPISENTLAQAVAGRQIAAGEGYTTLIKYPQTAAWLKQRGTHFERMNVFPELHQPPLYPAMIAGALWILPDSVQKELFTRATATGSFGADYVLLALNIALFWLTAWLTFLLGRRLFDEAVGAFAAVAVLLSLGLWRVTLAVNGMPLSMVLLLGLIYCVVRGDTAADGERGSASLWLFLAGLLSGLLFLCEYSAAAAVPVVLAFALVRFSRQRWRAFAFVTAGFAVVGTPWVLRNMAETDSPVALAWHGIALKAGDPTAEPSAARGAMSHAAPRIDIFKLGNKVLTELQNALHEQLWAGGFLLAAFFVAGLLYRFRSDRVNRLRWFAVALIGVLILGYGVFDSGEGERHPMIYAAPLIVIFGAGFFAVLIASSETWAAHTRGAMVLLLALQALPLARDALEPARRHFSYPPYYPPLFVGLRHELTRLGGPAPAWMADIPAGAAWYSGQPVWGQPTVLRDFYRIGSDQPMVALMLTPRTLERPLFADLARSTDTSDRLGEWSQVYRGLITGRYPMAFPLTGAQKISDTFYLLMDPVAALPRGK